MKKKIAFALAAALTMSLAAGCGSTGGSETGTSSAAASTASETASSGAVSSAASSEAASAGPSSSEEGRTTFTVGFDAEFPPYGFMGDDGEYTGFDLEFAQAVCDKEGWELVKQPIDWDSKDAELNSGTIDCIWNGFTMNGREDQYTWTEPYIDNSQVFVVPTDSGIESQADLAGKTVGVQKDSSALAALEGDSKDLADTFGTLTQYADYNTAFMDLEQGAIDAVAIDIGVANYEIGQRGDGYKILDDYLSTEQYAIAFAKGNTELRDQVQETLDEMAADGTVEKIVANYADYNLPAMLIIGK